MRDLALCHICGAAAWKFAAHPQPGCECQRCGVWYPTPVADTLHA